MQHVEGHDDYLRFNKTGEISPAGLPVWQLGETYRYCHTPDGCGLLVTVPAGFRTDFSSVPPIFHWFLQPAGKAARAGLVHDFLYSRAANCPRRLADAVFLDLLEHYNVPWFTRQVAWLAVRWLGGRRYQSEAQP